MENNKRIGLLTDDQVEQIKEVLGDNVSEDVKHLREIQGSESEKYPRNVLSNNGLVEDTAYVDIDPITGERRIVSEVPPSADVSLEDIVTGNDECKIEDIKLNSEVGKETFNSMGLNDEDAVSLLKIVTRVRNGEKFSIYNELPQSAKRMCFALAGTTDRRTLNTVAKDLINNFINQIVHDQEYIDFQESLEKELKLPGMVDMFSEYETNIMETELLKKAEALEEKNPKAAQKLRNIADIHADAISLSTLKELATNGGKLTKRLDREVNRFNNHCRDFNYKYENSKFKINDISLIAKSLDRLIPETYTGNDIKKFIIFFCRVCINMSPDNVVEHAFMYYTIKTLLSLEYLQQDNKFYIDTIKTVCEIIDLINK